MDRIVIAPRDKEEMNFLMELAKGLGIDAKTYEDHADEELLEIMEENKHTPLSLSNIFVNRIASIRSYAPALAQQTPSLAEGIVVAECEEPG